MVARFVSSMLSNSSENTAQYCTIADAVRFLQASDKQWFERRQANTSALKGFDNPRFDLWRDGPAQ
jgi:hypothetical protein